MSAQAAVVFLQSISEFTVNSISARYLINDATESNVAHQGIAAKDSIVGAFHSVKGWNITVKHLNKACFDVAVATRVVNAFDIFTQEYIKMLTAFGEKHDVFVSASSPFSPDGSKIMKEIYNLQSRLKTYKDWLKNFIDVSLKAKVDEHMKKVNIEYDKHTAKYPKPDKRASEAATEVVQNVSEVSE